jgi:hypothetical protein
MIPKFKDGKGAVIFKAHHTLADGIGFAFFSLAISEIWDKEALPAMRPLGFLKTALIYTLLPYFMIKTAFVFIF